MNQLKELLSKEKAIRENETEQYTRKVHNIIGAYLTKTDSKDEEEQGKTT